MTLYLKSRLDLITLLFLLFSGGAAGGADFCADDSARSALQPYLLSKEEIASKKCTLSARVHSKVDRTEEEKSSCVSTYESLNDCAEKYLASKTSGCQQLAGREVTAASQAEGFQEIRRRYTDAADLQKSLSRHLNACVKKAQATQSRHQKLWKKFVADRKAIDDALRTSRAPAEVLNASGL